MVRYVRWVIDQRKLVLLLLLGVTGLAGAVFSGGKVGSSVGNLFLGENPNYHKYLEKISDYGEDDVIVVALLEPRLLSRQSRARIAALSQTMARLPSIEGVRSVLDVQRIEGDPDAITVRSYAELAAEEPNRRAEWVRRLTREPFAQGGCSSRTTAAGPRCCWRWTRTQAARPRIYRGSDIYVTNR